ncbi:MAG: hypothetical protein WAU77_01740 [Solirubrobacteraceae bacterium]
MRFIKTIGLCFAITITISAVASGAASAAGPTFHFKGAAIEESLLAKGTSGPTSMWVKIFPGLHLICKKDKYEVTIEPGGGTKNLKITLEECEISGSPGCIVTVTIKALKDQLWWIEGTSKKSVADVLEAETGTEFGMVTLEKGGGSCPVEGKFTMTGNVAGEASPVNTEVVTESLFFKVSGEKQAIEEVQNETEKKKLKLEIAGSEARLESTEELQLAGSLEGQKFGIYS